MVLKLKAGQHLASSTVGDSRGAARQFPRLACIGCDELKRPCARRLIAVAGHDVGAGCVLVHRVFPDDLDEPVYTPSIGQLSCAGALYEKTVGSGSSPNQPVPRR